MGSRAHQLISNYYNGELVSLGFKLISAFFVLGVFVLLWHYYPIDIVVFTAYNIFIVYGIIIAKSIFQFFQYLFKRNRLIGLPSIPMLEEMKYIRAREETLTYHRRLHVYSLLISFIGLIIMLLFFLSYHQIISLFIALGITSTMLLSFSLFNSFRLSEYKAQMKGTFP